MLQCQAGICCTWDVKLSYINSCEQDQPLSKSFHELVFEYFPFIFLRELVRQFLFVILGFLVKHLLKKRRKSWCISGLLCVWWFSTHGEAECHFVSGDAEHPVLSAQAWLCRIAAVSVEQGLGLMCWAREGRGCFESDLLLFPVYLCSITHEHQKVFSFSPC